MKYTWNRNFWTGILMVFSYSLAHLSSAATHSTNVTLTPASPTFSWNPSIQSGNEVQFQISVVPESPHNNTTYRLDGSATFSSDGIWIAGPASGNSRTFSATIPQDYSSRSRASVSCRWLPDAPLLGAGSNSVPIPQALPINGSGIALLTGSNVGVLIHWNYIPATPQAKADGTNHVEYIVRAFTPNGSITNADYNGVTAHNLAPSSANWTITGGTAQNTHEINGFVTSDAVSDGYLKLSYSFHGAPDTDTSSQKLFFDPYVKLRIQHPMAQIVDGTNLNLLVDIYPEGSAYSVSDVAWTLNADHPQPKNSEGRANISDDIKQAGTGMAGWRIDTNLWYGYGTFSYTNPSPTLNKTHPADYNLSANVTLTNSQGRIVNSSITPTNYIVQLGAGAGMLIPRADRTPSAYIATHHITSVFNRRVSGSDAIYDAVFQVPTGGIKYITKEGVVLQPGPSVINQYKQQIKNEETFHKKQWEGDVSYEQGGCADLGTNEGALEMLKGMYGATHISNNVYQINNISVTTNISHTAEQNEVKDKIKTNFIHSISYEIQFSTSFFGYTSAQPRAKFTEWKAKMHMETPFREAYLYFFTYHLINGWELEPVNETGESARNRWIDAGGNF